MLVLATSVLVIVTSIEAKFEAIPDQPIVKLSQVLCIHYPTQFSQHLIKAFLNSDNKVNVIPQSFVKKLSFYI